MALERFPENNYNENKKNTISYSPQTPEKPKKGKYIAVSISLLILSVICSYIWNNFFRYDAYGIVDAESISIFSKIEGTLTNMPFNIGNKIIKNDEIGLIVNKDLQREYDKIVDEINIKESELYDYRTKNKQRELEWSITESKTYGKITMLSNQLKSLKNQYGILNDKLKRVKRLKNTGSASNQEYDNILVGVSELQRVINEKQDEITILKTSLHDFIPDSYTSTLSQLNSLNNSKNRLLDKINDGQLISPISGIVSEVFKRNGEGVNKYDSIISIISTDTTRLILFYDPADKLPHLGDNITILILSLQKTIRAKVVSISKDVVSPPDQIKRLFNIDQKLVRVYLQPDDDLNDFVIGSVIKKPNPSDIIMNTLHLVKSSISGDKAYANERGE